MQRKSVHEDFSSMRHALWHIWWWRERPCHKRADCDQCTRNPKGFFPYLFGTFSFPNLLASAHIGRNIKPTCQSCDQQSREHVPNPSKYSMWGRRRPAKIGEVLVNGLTLHYYFLPQKYIIQLVRSLRTSPQ